MAAMLQTSVLAPHLLPKMTSGDRYWRVWMSFVKWCPTQQAFPRSAILTEIFSNARSGVFSADFSFEDVDCLSRLMSDTSLVRRSLCSVSNTHYLLRELDLRCLLALLLHVILAGGGLQAEALCHGHAGGL